MAVAERRKATGGFASQGRQSLVMFLMKIRVLISVLILSFALFGCGNGAGAYELDLKQKHTIEVDSLSYTGDIKYEVTEAFITQAPVKAGIDPDMIDKYTSIMFENSSGEIEEAHKDEFLNKEGDMNYEAVMYVLHVKVTNINAEYKHYKEYGFSTPYMFRADNLHLNFVNEKGKAILSKDIDYYSNRQEDEARWSSFELSPGETIEYDIGFIVGSLYRDGGVTYYLNDYSPLLSSVQGGLEQDAKQYQLVWEDRR